jgi:hypothetical protein
MSAVKTSVCLPEPRWRMNVSRSSFESTPCNLGRRKATPALTLMKPFQKVVAQSSRLYGTSPNYLCKIGVEPLRILHEDEEEEIFSLYRKNFF